MGKINEIKEKIKNVKIAKKEHVATTIRIPKEPLSVIDEMSIHLDVSRQQMMLDLIEIGIESVEKELGIEKAETQMDSNFYILNTNKRNCIQDQERMLKEKIAAAFYEGWKELIDEIQKGDVIFLYENGLGIVAYGTGTGKTVETDYYGEEGEMHYQKLEGFTELTQPLPASEIKKILGRDIVFLRTMIGIPNGQKVLEKCISMAAS